MQKIFFIVLAVIAYSASAQLTVTPGSQLNFSGNAQLVLLNTDLINNGNLNTGTGKVTFLGNVSSDISGSQTTQFYALEINKGAASSVVLQRPVNVSQQINFLAGNLDLNGFNLDLGNTGSLNGEQETSHVIGASGGTISFNTLLNAPSSANPGNLGILITSSQNLGNTIIRRGHQSQASLNGSGSSVLRYYDITPAVNSSLNATLRFNYLTAELNGLDENALIQWEKQTAPNWVALGYDGRNTSTNYVEENGISTFGRFTLSTVNNALPVKFISFNTQCNGSAVLLTWKTAEEQNSSYYLVQRSADGVDWIAEGNVQAAGNANTENDYSYIDNAPVANSYYRIAEYDLDGKSQFTKALLTSCSSQEVFRLWPNPVTDVLYINMTVNTSSPAIIKLYDGKGALIKQQSESLLRGNNLLNVNVKGLASGVYFATITYNNGQLYTQKVMKE